MPRMLRVLLDQNNRMHTGWKALVFFGLYWILLTVLKFPAVVLQWLVQKGASGFDFRLGILIGCSGVLLATWICTAMEGAPLASVGLSLNRRWFRGFLTGTLGGMAIIGATALSIFLLGGFRWVRDPSGSLLGFVAGIPLFLLVAMKEEALFRGYAFQRLVENLGPWSAQALMAALFISLHLGNPGMTGSTRLWACLNLGLASLMLGIAYLKTKSLALPMGLHFGWNWAQGNLLGFGVSGTTAAHGLWMPVFSDKPQWISGGAFGLEASLPCAIASSLAIVTLLLWRPRGGNPAGQG